MDLLNRKIALMAMLLVVVVTQSKADDCVLKRDPRAAPEVLKFSVECARPVADSVASPSEVQQAVLKPYPPPKKLPKIEMGKPELPKLNLPKFILPKFKLDLPKLYLPKRYSKDEVITIKEKTLPTQVKLSIMDEPAEPRMVAVASRDTPTLFKRPLVKEDLRTSESNTNPKKLPLPKRFKQYKDKPLPELVSLFKNAEPVSNGLTQEDLDGKSCDICDCLLKVFPKKMEEDPFGMEASEPRQAILPSAKPLLKLPKLKSRSQKNKQTIVETKDKDQAVMEDFVKPTYVLPPSKSLRSQFRSQDVDEEADNSFGMPDTTDVTEQEIIDNEIEEPSAGEKARKVEEGIEKLIEFVNIVDQIDQYISSKTKQLIVRLAQMMDDRVN